MNLQEILTADEFAIVQAKLGDKKIIIDDGNLIPKHRFDEVNEQKKNLQSLFDNSTKEIESLKNNVKGNEELSKQLEALQQAQIKMQEETKQKELLYKKQYTLKESLLNEGVTDSKARELLIKSFELDKVELDENGSIKDFVNLLKPLKESPVLASLFSTGVKVPTVHNGGAYDPKSEYYTPEQLKNISVQEARANLEKVNKSLAYHSKNK